jgi:hypothetical protein
MSSSHGRSVQESASPKTGSSSEGGGYDDMVGRLSPKDRQNMEKQLNSYDETGDKSRATLWKRLVGAMSDLAPLPPKTSAQRTVQFFVPDGKWRMQVFAIEDRKDGNIAIYTEDVLAEALKAGVVTKAKKTAAANPGEYTAKGADRPLVIEQLDGKSEADPAPFYKDMLGWNRKAIRVTLAGDAPEALAKAVERICEMAALRRKPKSEK